MVARRTLTPTLGAELKKLKAATEKTSTRPYGQKIMGDDSALEVYDSAGTLAVRISPNGSYFTGTIDVTSAGSSIRAFNEAGQQTLDLNGDRNVIVGQIRTGVMGTPQIVLQPSANGTLGLWFSPDGGTPGFGFPAGYVGGIWMNENPSITEPRALNIRGQSGAGLRLYGGVDLYPTEGKANAVLNTYGSMDIDTEQAWIWSRVGRVNLVPTMGVRFATRQSNGSVGSGYEYTTGSAANMHMDAAGVLFKSTSARRYKTDIAEYRPDPAWLDIPVVSWRDRLAIAEAEAVPDDAPRPLTIEQQAALDRAAIRHVGTLAEDAEAAAPLQIMRDHTGRVDGYAYDRDGAILRYFVRGHRDRLDAHERRLAALEAALRA